MSDLEQKKLDRMYTLYNAIEKGYTVRKLDNQQPNTFELTISQSLDPSYKGLVIFSNRTTICEEIEKHLKSRLEKTSLTSCKSKRSISEPIKYS